MAIVRKDKNGKDIQIGDTVLLLKKPGGWLSSEYALTVGRAYTCIGFMGCCITTTTDRPGETGSYYPSQVEKLEL
jgi:hypothetical protein